MSLSYNTTVPPDGDGWFLAYDPSDGWKAIRTWPWRLATRCDNGFCDEEGYPVEPTGWVAIPDPQPKPTGWRRPVGSIRIGTGKIKETGWSGWIVDIVMPDGAYDDTREPLLFNTLAPATAYAEKFGALWELPIIQADALSNVVDFRGAKGGGQ